MYASFFFQAESAEQSKTHNLMKNVVRIFRDLIALVNTFFKLAILHTFVDYLNQLVGDKLNNDVAGAKNAPEKKFYESS